jgi:hypothetical protein
MRCLLGASVGGRPAAARVAGSRHGAAPPAPSRPNLSRRAAVRVQAMSEGVQDLLARDRRRKADLAAAEFDLPEEPQQEQQAAPAPAEAGAEASAEEEGSGGRRGGRAGRLKSRQQRRKDMVLNEESAGGSG